MINNYPANSIGYKVMNHDNDYKADIFSIFNSHKEKLPSVSIVIPYFEAWNTINWTLEYLVKALEQIEYEIIVVDDGSKKCPAEKCIIDKNRKNLMIKTLQTNKGRSCARNSGLIKAKNDVVAFMDADMVIPCGIIEKHLKLHKYFSKQDKGCISFSLFNNVSVKEWGSVNKKEILFGQTNDFRNECLYQESWIGCEADKEYVGRAFRILADTDYLKNWPVNHTFGPWLLPNMVLGGFFTANRERVLVVGGFSEDFKQYGFTETPVSTKLIAKFDDYVIPVLEPYVLHLHDGGVSLNQEERDEYFKKAHHLFFEVYLKQDLEQTIKNEKL